MAGFSVTCIFAVISVASFKYGLPTEHRIPADIPDVSSNTYGDAYDDITVTVVRTLDDYRTVTDTFYNSVPVTITEFVKSTVTLPTREVVRTPVDDVVKISTVEVTRPTTETVTDVSSRFKCSTEVSTEFFTITHLDQRILQTTVTSTIVATHQFHPTIVRTVILTERETATETVIVSDTIWIEKALTKTRTPHHY